MTSGRSVGSVGVDREIIQLRRELSRLKRQVRDNEAIWAEFRQLEIDAVGAESLPALIHGISHGLRRAFSRVDAVAVACINIDYEVANIVDEKDGRHDIGACFEIISVDELQEIIRDETKPWLGVFDDARHTRLFPNQSKVLKSVALAPLNVAGACVGCLCQGSRHESHFSEDTSTELLEHLASTLALCIQNSVNKARLQRHGLTDPLTGVANRRLLMRRLREEMDRCRRYDHPVSCIMLDLDYFKQINDRYGHTVGDRMLVQVAEALKRGLRSSDLLARYGGEEFVLLLPETTQELALEIAKRHHREIAGLQLRDNDHGNISITASFGVAELVAAGHSDIEDAEVLVKQADAAMYAAKRAGRNRIVAANRD
ncbi:MAG: DUF484 family protein [Gammaproteobacteria bacterium]|nr:DUF484 family protein [Gammaproteobacteria bacterium]MDH3464458.1 DUF484 family protein [Gammaproteobacteria bacterium]